MSIVDELIASIRRDAPVQQVQISPFWTAVVANRCGLASTPPTGQSHAQLHVPEAGRLTEHTALELARAGQSGGPLEKAVGIAALNALIEVDESLCVELNALQVLLERGRGKHVALVGHFPFVPALREEVRQLSVLELSPREGDLAAGRAVEVIPEADVVAITGSSLVNGTFDGLLELCSPEAFVMVLGPTTPLSPVLFDHGVQVVSGTLVTDVPLALRYAAEGAAFKQIKGVRLVSLFRDR